MLYISVRKYSTHIERYMIIYLLFLLSLIFTVITAPVYALDILEHGDTACSDGSSDGSGQGMAGKPINLFTGAETLTHTDLIIGNLYPIVIQRRYISTSRYDSPLGYGWALNYDKRLFVYPDGSVTIRKDCGQKLRFTPGSEGYSSSLGNGDVLVQNNGIFTYTANDGTKEIYDYLGRLSKKVATNGNSLAFTYGSDIRGPLTGVSLFSLDPITPQVVSYYYQLNMIEEMDANGLVTGNRVILSYDTSSNHNKGRLNGIWDNASRSVIYDHNDAFGNLTGVNGPSANSTYGYNDSRNIHSVTSINEGNGEYINGYDDKGRVFTQTHGTGAIVFDYLTDLKVKVTTTVKDSEGVLLNTAIRTVDFNDEAMVVKSTDSYGNVTNYVRDPVSLKIFREEHWQNLGSIETPDLVLKSATQYTYDTKGNILTRTEAQGTAQEKTTTYTYHPTFNTVETETVKSVVDPSQNRVVTNVYDGANGNLLTTAETGLLDVATSYTYTTTYGYNGAGQLTSIDGPRTDVQDVTSFGYDPITGYRTTMTQPIIGTTVYSNFNALGSPQTVTDPNGNSTIYTYYPDGKVSTVKAPGDTNATQYFYVTSCGASCSGKLDHIVLPEGNTITYGYDGLGNVATITDDLGNSIIYTYDSEGNKIKEVIRDEANKTLSYEYDALNRLHKVINPDTNYTQYTYDSLGNRISLRTPNAALSTYRYDALNRLIAVIQPGTVTTGYGYNTNNNLTTVTDDNDNTTTYKYDDHGRVYQVISPDTGTTTYHYDPAGNMISKKDAKDVTIIIQL